MAKTTANIPAAKVIEITSIGPNGINDATFHVHAAGCADIKRGIKAGKGSMAAADYRRAEKNDMFVESFRDMVEQDFSDMIAENEGSAWEDYANEYRIFPCVTFPEDRAEAKPAEAPAAPAKPAKASRKPAAKSAPANSEKLTTAQKQVVRKQMSVLLREAGNFTDAEQAYIEAHWLKYIDPDLDAARRAASK